jgi:hypothetical protein
MSADQKSSVQEVLERLHVPAGLYQHWKGPLYVAFSNSIHEKSGEALVHYYSLEKRTRWTRTHGEWNTPPTIREQREFLRLCVVCRKLSDNFNRPVLCSEACGWVFHCADPEDYRPLHFPTEEELSKRRFAFLRSVGQDVLAMAVGFGDHLLLPEESEPVRMACPKP